MTSSEMIKFSDVNAIRLTIFYEKNTHSFLISLIGIDCCTY